MKRIIKEPTKSLAALVLTLAGFASQAVADPVPDMTLTALNRSLTINNAIFSTASTNHGFGSGNVNAFLRTKNSPLEEGFNTDAPQVLDNVAGNFTHAVLLKDLRVTTITIDLIDKEYVSLLLDINEASGGNKNLIDLLDLQLFVNTGGPSPNQPPNPSVSDYAELGTKIWDLDAGSDKTLRLDYDLLTNGSGGYDIRALFDPALFTPFKPTDYFYLYNKFGNTDRQATGISESGYEEWVYDTAGKSIFPPPPSCDDPAYKASHPDECGTTPPISVPEPGSVALLGIGLLMSLLTFRNRINQV